MSYNILSVDELGITKIEIANLLRDINVNITNVNNDIEAANILQNKKDFNIIIWTINSIDESDYIAIKKLKSREAHKNIPIIIVSKFTDKKYIIKAIEAGANEYIAKPYDEEAVVKKICKILGVQMGKPMLKTLEEDIIVFNFSEMLNKEIKAAARGAYEISIMMVSVMPDAAKVIVKDNSDEIVVLINKVLKGRLRETDSSFQYGTSNIILLLPFAGKEGVTFVEKKIVEIFNSHSLIKQKGGENYNLVTASVTCPDDGKVKDKLLEKLEKSFSESMITSENSF